MTKEHETPSEIPERQKRDGEQLLAFIRAGQSGGLIKNLFAGKSFVGNPQESTITHAAGYLSEYGEKLGLTMDKTQAKTPADLGAMLDQIAEKQGAEIEAGKNDKQLKSNRRFSIYLEKSPVQDGHRR
jgi:hypothetical protein